jgi:hypothetical protein
MTATKRNPLVLVDDEVTVFVQRPSFVDEEAVTKVNLSPVRAVPPLVTSRGDEPTRIIDAPWRLDASRATARDTADIPTIVTRGRRSLRLAMAVVALVIAGLLGVLWRRAHVAPPRGVVAAVTTTIAPPSPPVPPNNVEPPPSAAVSTPPLTASVTSRPDLPPAPSSDERAAVESVASGSYAQAARLYQALAIAHPTNDAYRAAARILLDRAKESTR